MPLQQFSEDTARTLYTSAQAVSADQQKAHRKIVRMVLRPKFPDKLRREAQPRLCSHMISNRNCETTTDRELSRCPAMLSRDTLQLA